jgi:hypothetical protein
LTGEDLGCEQVGTRRVKGSHDRQPADPNGERRENRENWRIAARTTNHTGPDGLETVPAWRCAEGCPVAELDAQSGIDPGGKPRPFRRVKETTGWSGGSHPMEVAGFDRGDSGGASRFFYCSKASRRDRNEGCEGMEERESSKMGDGLRSCVGHPNPNATGTTSTEDRRAANHHPCVKPTPLMQWLIRLISKPGDLILDPFAGSGSTLKAAILEGRSCIGIERDPQYVAIARARIASALASAPLFSGAAP